MRLQSLEIKGFKSFADKTILNFNDNIIGIVGPNGCGKSNIVDSIRWVVGEQKIRNLRSSNLENLIFNGAKNRSPSSIAEVNMTFEGTKNIISNNYDTITITRRYLKNGDSEYKINDILCKHKDIQSLLIDSGISSDSYAIIELSMIDDLVRNKENSRKKMLEQAAGISLFKIRKKESEQKLNLINIDMDRIDDLLHEIETQITFFENQARKTEKHKKLSEEYKMLFFDYTNLSIKDTQDNLKSKRVLIAETEDALGRVTTQIREEEANIESLKMVLIEKEDTLKHEQKELNQLKTAITENEKNRTLKNQEIFYEEQKIEECKKTMESNNAFLKENHATHEENNTLLKQQQKVVEQLLSQKTLLINNNNELLQKKEMEQATYDSIYGEYKSFCTKIEQNEKQMALSENSLKNIEDANQRLVKEDEELTIQLEEAIDEKKLVESDYARQNKALNVLQEKNSILANKKKAIEEDISHQKDIIYKVSRELDANKNEYELLKSIIDNMEGYPESMRYLKTNENWYKEFPILSDIVEIDEHYKIALENILEPYLNYFIVDDIPDAESAIDLLHNSQKGKSSFFILSLFRSKESSGSNSIQMEGVVNAIDLVHIHSKYKNMMAELLKNVFIVEGSHIRDLIKQYPDYIFIQKDGHYYKNKHAMIGGSIGLFDGNKVGRLGKLEQLSKEVTKNEGELNTLNQKLNSSNEEWNRMNETMQNTNISSIDNTIKTLNNRLISLDNTISYLSSSIEKNKEIISTNKEKMNTLKGEIDIFMQNIHADKSLLIEYENKRDTQAEVLKKYNDEAYEVEKKMNAIHIDIAEQKSSLENINTKISYSKGQIDRLKNQNNGITNQINELTNKRENNNNLLENISIEHQKHIEKSAVYTKKVGELENEYNGIKQNVGDKEKFIKALYIKKQNYEELKSKEKELISESKLSLVSVEERLAIEFDTTLEQISDKPIQTNLPLEKLQEKIAMIKNRISNLGEINYSALDAYEEIKARKELIQNQREDLLKSKKNLTQTINEVEAKAHEHFTKTFKQVRDNFQMVFKKFFSEDDNCDLILTNPDNISETNIEIVAKPKGKKPSNISQLSGGEKSLTAVSLLFAFYLIKPAPFCIFDEIDAPLDDNNIERFNKMIKAFSDKSQFIVVTHNKLTMAAMNKIYGVTMEEAGVSKLVPVSFKELDTVAV